MSLQMFTTRRRATDRELQQGEEQMKAAQQRLDAELAAGSEPQLEDSKGPEVSQSQESPKIPEVEKDLGREEGPRGSPKSFAPAAAIQDVSAVVAGSPERPKSESKTPLKTEEPGSALTEAKTPMQTPMVATESAGALVPASTVISATKTESTKKGAANGPLSGGNDSGRLQQPDPSSSASRLQVAATPAPPLFDEQQVRQFQELFSQAPWLYPGIQQFAVPQMTLPPPVARPLFLEQDERRIQGVGQQVEASQFMYPYGQTPGRESLELRRELELLMDENRRLRSRVEALETSQKSEEPQFSTASGDQKEAETTKEAVRPPEEGQSRSKGVFQEAERPPKERAEDPRRSKATEAETTKEAEYPQAQKSKESSFTERSLEFMAIMMD